MNLSNKNYDVLKWIAQILLPAIGTLYAALAGIWRLPFPQEVLATIMAIDAFLGILLGLSSATYNTKTDSNVVTTNIKTDADLKSSADSQYQEDRETQIKESMDRR